MPNTGQLLPLLAVIAIAGLISAIVAFLVGTLTLRLKGIYFAIFTFGLVELIKQLLLSASLDGYLWWYGPALRLGNRCHCFCLLGRNVTNQVPLLLHAHFWYSISGCYIISAQWTGRIDTEVVEGRFEAAECQYLKVKQEIAASKKVVEVYLGG